VVEGGVGQPHILRAVQTDAVRLHLHVVVAVASSVEDDARGFVDLQERSDLEARSARSAARSACRSDRKDRVPPAVPLRFPDEATAVFENVIDGLFSIHPVGHSSRTIVRVARSRDSPP
jgi:hypothetical protein